MSKVAIAAARTGRIQRLSGETASKHVSVEGVKHHHFSQRQHSNRVTTTDILSVVSVPCEVSRTGSVHDSWTLEIPSCGSHPSHHGRKGLTITGYLVWALVRTSNTSREVRGHITPGRRGGTEAVNHSPSGCYPSRIHLLYWVQGGGREALLDEDGEDLLPPLHRD